MCSQRATRREKGILPLWDYTAIVVSARRPCRPIFLMTDYPPLALFYSIVADVDLYSATMELLAVDVPQYSTT